MNELIVIYKDIGELIPYINNPRKNTSGIDKVASSIKTFGFKVPVIIDSKNEIIAGHTRILAAQKLKLDKIPCIVADDLTEAQIKAFRIADNKVAEYSEWDMELLNIELQELAEMDFNLSFTGFDEIEIQEITDGEPPTIIEDEVPEPPEVPITKLGDIWQLGRHRLMCGDSTGNDVSVLMDGQKSNMVFTDPPYGYEYQSNMRTKTDKFEVLKNDDKILDFMPVLIPHVEGFVFICTTWKVLDKWLPLFKQHFELSNMIIWDKGGGGIGDLKKTFSTDYEIILVSHQGKELKGKRIGSVWNIPKDSAGDYVHATQKPVKLSALAIEETTQSNSIVLDVFGGSGSTLMACEQTNRICYMMELDEKNCDVIVQRWENFTGQKAVLLNG